MPRRGRLRPASPLRAFRAGDRRRHGGTTLDHNRSTGTGWWRTDRIRDRSGAPYPRFDGYNERIRVPGGFRVLPPTERRWHALGQAMFSVFPGVRENYEPWADDVLRLITIRSHDQYNTTIWPGRPLSRRVRPTGRVVHASRRHGRARPGAWRPDRDQTISANRALRLGGITVIEYDIARGSVAAYYPEANVLVPLDYIDEESGTPSYKSIPVRLRQETARGLSRRAE